MKGLLLKDTYMAIKSCKSYLLIVLVFTVMALFDSDNTFFILYPAILASMIPVTLISFDERSKWDVYCDALPFSRSQVVSEKYLLTLLISLAILILTILAQGFRLLSTSTLTFSEYEFLLCTLIAISLLGPSFLLPFIFRYDVEKGRIAYYIVLIVLASASAILSKVKEEIASPALESFGNLFLLILSFAVFFLSWRISVMCYRKKEF